METVKRVTPQVLLVSIAVSFASYFVASQSNTVQHYFTSSPSLNIKAPHEIVDVLVIGGGAAGLSAATTLYRHQHDIRIFDDERPRNSWNTLTHALPTWEGERPSKIRQKSRKELEKTGLVEFISSRVSSIRQDNNTFRVVTSDGIEWAGRKVLLSMGADFQFLDIPGYKECFPDKIFHCLFTFGWEHRGSSSAGILASGFAGIPFHASILIDDARKFAEKITIYTHGNQKLAEDIRDAARDNATLYDARKIIRMEKLPDGVLIEFEDGEIKEEAFIVHQPSTRVNPAFVEQLDLKLNERGDIITKMPFHQTNVPGVYAAGDCASPFKIIANAMLMGANAGAGLARELSVRVTGHPIDRLSSTALAGPG